MCLPILLGIMGSLRERNEKSPYVIAIVFASDFSSARDEVTKELAAYKRREEDVFYLENIGSVHCQVDFQPFTACVYHETAGRIK